MVARDIGQVRDLLINADPQWAQRLCPTVKVAVAASTPATLGLLLLLIGVRQFRGRPRNREEPAMPKWMTTVDKTSPLAAAGLAAALSGINPKNLLLAVGGAAAIASTGISGADQANCLPGVRRDRLARRRDSGGPVFRDRPRCSAASRTG